MLNQYEPLEQPGVALSMPEYPTSSEIHEVISKEKQSHLSDILLLLIIIFYLIVVIAFFIALGTSQHFRQFLFDFFSDNYENDVYGLLYIGAFELVLIITGFDIFLMDILFGFFIRPYLTALTLLFATKMAGKFLCFALVKYCFKEEIYQAFKGNIFFKTFYVAAQINPIKILAILQLITLPTAFKTYVVGVFAVSTPQYLVVTSISNFMWTGFWVHVGVQAKNVKTFIETGKSSDIMPLQVQMIIFFGGICALGYLLKLTNQVYQSIVQEVQGLEKDRK
ncbi:unnamed protein product (macronuclear) [Paramecium tetraurelia]|uniref:VTT domain-containing protein n=1 Tax=Paramecium tetraurelia TaxID=5888 RepID=A0E1R1_PARTE|nr:uncharacterized protein GSPATT00022399001 [Paramecium tetraurelia]CAK89228.1 unnamed protein product [Paramecium tetraurelia]|eukprot:XP_001456625.1 hypothetical protein (macronuclear) [Paramecium tetraurelia strain d4-2]